MFDYIYEWIQNIAFYMILATAVIQVIPNTGYKKYIRFFTGLILVVLLSTPILKVFGMEEGFHELYNSISYKQEIKEIEEKTKYLEEVELPSDITGQEMSEDDDGIEVEGIEIGE